MTAHECRLFVHFRLLTLRNLNTIVMGELFDKVFEKATHDKRTELRKAIEALDHNLLARLLREQSKQDLGTMPMKDLRKLAQSYGVPQYSILPKANLLSAITNIERLKHGTMGSKSELDHEQQAAPQASANDETAPITCESQTESFQGSASPV